MKMYRPKIRDPGDVCFDIRVIGCFLEVSVIGNRWVPLV